MGAIGRKKSSTLIKVVRLAVGGGESQRVTAGEGQLWNH